MRIDAIRNCRMAYSAPKTSSSHSLPKKNETQLNTLSQDTVSFKKGSTAKSANVEAVLGNTVKGAAVGTGLGLFAITALAAVSGLTLSPIAAAAYAAAFGIAGGTAGKALDNAEKNSEVKIA